MNVSLTPKLEKYLHEKVASGFYTSVSEVIRESLRLMRLYEDLKKEQIKQLNQAIEGGLTQLAAGDKVLASEAYQRLKKKIKKVA